MKRILTWLAAAVGALVVVAGLGLGGAYVASERRFARRFDVPTEQVAVPNDAAAIARGRHVATTRGCVGCHHPDLGGGTFIDAMPVARLGAANLTRGRGGVLAMRTDADLVRAIRHGVRADGSPLYFMPAQEFNALSDEDLGALIAFLRSMPGVDRTPPTNSIGPVGRLLYLAGKVPLIPAELIDHRAPRRPAPARGPTAAYGAYLAESCRGCHGDGFSGGKIPGAPPEMAIPLNITPDPVTGIGRWTLPQFATAVRTGRLPNGRQLAADMPYREYAEFADDEIAALYAFLQTRPPRPFGQR